MKQMVATELVGPVSVSRRLDDPDTGFHAGWHQDEDHPDLGRAHFQYSSGLGEDEAERRRTSVAHDTPSLVRWETVEELLGDVLPTYQWSRACNREESSVTTSQTTRVGTSEENVYGS